MTPVSVALATVGSVAGAVEVLLDVDVCDAPLVWGSEGDPELVLDPGVPLDRGEEAELWFVESVLVPALVLGVLAAVLVEVVAALAVVVPAVDLPAVVVEAECLNSVMYPYPPHGCPDAPPQA